MIIYKYPLLDRQAVITLPKGAKFLSVQAQRDEPQMWFLIDQVKKMEDRCFITVATGDRFSIHSENKPGFVYLGTYQLFNGDLVYHVFEQL